MELQSSIKTSSWSVDFRQILASAYVYISTYYLAIILELKIR